MELHEYIDKVLKSILRLFLGSLCFLTLVIFPMVEGKEKDAKFLRNLLDRMESVEKIEHCCDCFNREDFDTYSEERMVRDVQKIGEFERDRISSLDSNNELLTYYLKEGQSSHDSLSAMFACCINHFKNNKPSLKGMEERKIDTKIPFIEIKIPTSFVVLSIQVIFLFLILNVWYKNRELELFLKTNSWVENQIEHKPDFFKIKIFTAYILQIGVILGFFVTVYLKFNSDPLYRLIDVLEFFLFFISLFLYTYLLYLLFKKKEGLRSESIVQSVH